MIKFGIIGAGIISSRNISAIMLDGRAKVMAVADINEEKANDTADKYKITPYYDYKEMINCEELDAVVINLPHYLHKECGVYCAEHGLHVFLEKPMAVSTEECEEIIRAADDNSVKLMIGHVQRYFPENIKAKEIIKSGELGKVAFIVDVRNVAYFTSVRPRWFLNKKLSGGGVMMNFGAHSLDKIIWLMESEVRSITGKVGSFNPQFDIEGHAQAFVEMKNGVTAVINFSGYDSNPINETKIYFSQGELKLCTGKGLWISRGGEYEEVHIENKKDPFELQMSEFIDCITYNKESPIPGIYGEKIIEAIEKVYGA